MAPIMLLTSTEFTSSVFTNQKEEAITSLYAQRLTNRGDGNSIFHFVS
jgi:hypothetical protein